MVLFSNDGFLFSSIFYFFDECQQIYWFFYNMGLQVGKNINFIIFATGKSYTASSR
jgi:hypothetical protein